MSFLERFDDTRSPQTQLRPNSNDHAGLYLQLSSLAKRLSQLTIVIILAFYFYGLGLFPLVGPDEPRYAQVAREMFASGSLVTPTLAGHPWYEKPILLYWMMETAFALFGISEFAARFGPALCGVLTVIAVWIIGRRIENVSGDAALKGLGIWSAIMLGSLPAMIVFSRGASFDMVVTMTITWAFCFFLLADFAADARRRRWYYAGFYVFIGLSLLAKGLIGIVLPAGVITLFWLLNRRRPPKHFWTNLWWGAPVAIAVAALWYVPMVIQHGWVFVDQFLIQHHFARYLSNRYRHPQPFLFYFVIIFPMVMPWLVFSIAALGKARRWAWSGSTPLDRYRVFMFVAVLFPFTFFTFSGSKLPGYILPVMPPLALLAAERFLRVAHEGKAKRGMRWAAASLIFFAVVAPISVVVTNSYELVPSLIIVTPILLGALAALIIRHAWLGAQSIAISIVVCVLIALNLAAPRVAGTQSTKTLLEIAGARGYGQAPVYLLHEVDRSTEFYAAGRLVYEESGEPHRFEGANQILLDAKNKSRKILVLVPSEYSNQVTEVRTVTSEVLGENQSLTLIGVELRD